MTQGADPSNVGMAVTNVRYSGGGQPAPNPYKVFEHRDADVALTGNSVTLEDQVTKGARRVAQRIREVAEQNGVPLVENPPLARSLYAGVDINQPIPTKRYVRG